MFLCMSWAIWRLRNEFVMGGKRQELSACFKLYKDVLDVCQLAFSTITVPIPPNTAASSGTQRDFARGDSLTCYVDGSWSSDGLAGIGGYIIQGGRITQWMSKRVGAVNPAQAEAMAVLQGYLMLLSIPSEQRAQLYSDSLEMVDSLAHNQPVVHDWRAFNEVWEAWKLQRRAVRTLKTTYCDRLDPKLQMAHTLANLGRVIGWDRQEQGLDLGEDSLGSCVTTRIL
ncbi:hypothetical protein FCM35_KLT02857 [Carex littledalei]|uniref:Uncharacterized protein n=1 Tax=Carex littledalei TaxID=544730 RepID=A0A833VAV0_9POAL|nr:hypothetical protein FCM35_KLT02857 [Carex littledalei]